MTGPDERRCAYCLSTGAVDLGCATCFAAHHLDCWQEYGGCSIPGCASTDADWDGDDGGVPTVDGGHGAPEIPMEASVEDPVDSEDGEPAEQELEPMAEETLPSLEDDDTAPLEEKGDLASTEHDASAAVGDDAAAVDSAASWGEVSDTWGAVSKPWAPAVPSTELTQPLPPVQPMQPFDEPFDRAHLSPSSPLTPPRPRRRAGRVLIGVAVVVAAVGAGVLGALLTSSRPVQVAVAPSPSSINPEPTEVVIEMPDLVDMHVDDIADVLASLDIRRFERNPEEVDEGDDIDDGTVLRQVPRAGEEIVPDNVVVDVYVARVRPAPPPPPPPPPPSPPPPPPAAPSPPPPPAPVSYTVARTTISHADGPAIADTFERWATGINFSDYSGAFATYSSRLQGQVGFETFRSGNLSSIIDDVSITAIRGSGSSRTVAATMVSYQSPEDGHNGQSCSAWQMEYGMRSDGGSWLIDTVREVTGGPDPC